MTGDMKKHAPSMMQMVRIIAFFFMVLSPLQEAEMDPACPF